MSKSDQWCLLKVYCREHSYAYVDIKVSDIDDDVTSGEIADEVKRIARNSQMFRQHACDDDQMAIFNITPMILGAD